MKNFLSSQFVKRTGAFVLLWSMTVVLVNLLGNNDTFGVAAALWTLSIIGIYIWKVWGQKKSLLNKVLYGLLVWIVGSISGSIFGAIVAGYSAFGLMAVAYILLVSPLFGGENDKSYKQ